MVPVRVLEEMPELGAGLSPDALAAARRVPARVVSVREGAIEFGADLGAAPGNLGLLVLKGLLLRRIEERLLVTFWHLADRFGRMTSRGVPLPLPLPHRTLASIVGARRQSVTSALTILRDEGRVERTEEGWLLPGSAPEQLGRLRRDSALPPPRPQPG